METVAAIDLSRTISTLLLIGAAAAALRLQAARTEALPVND